MYFVYKQIDVVKEERLYPSWNKDLTNPDQNINLSFGITNGKRLLNNLHYELAMGGYKEVKPQARPPAPIVMTRSGLWEKEKEATTTTKTEAKENL